MNRARTFNQFINEAYLDDSGELQDFDAPRGDEYEYQLLEQAQRVQEYLEEAGANRVRLKIDDPHILLKFNYAGTILSISYFLNFISRMIYNGFSKKKIPMDIWLFFDFLAGAVNISAFNIIG